MMTYVAISKQELQKGPSKKEKDRCSSSWQAIYRDLNHAYYNKELELMAPPSSLNDEEMVNNLVDVFLLGLKK